MRQKLIASIAGLSLLLSFLLSASLVWAAASVSTPATANVSSDSTGSGTSVSLPNIVVTEGAAGDIATGLHTWTLPSGFVFDQTSVANVAYTGTGLAGTAVVSFPSSTTMTVNITGASSAAGTMTIGSSTPIKVRASSGTPLASGNITMTGGTIAGVSGATNFGTLTQVAGAATKLGFTTQTNTTVVRAATFVPVVVSVQDQFGNTVTSSSASITLTSVLSSNHNTSTTSALQGTLTRSASSGQATFNDLSYAQSDNMDLVASSSGLTPATSTDINVITSTSSTTAAPPSSVIISPAAGATIAPGSSVVITGTAAQHSPQSVQFVQLSFDNGATWVNATATANGFATWSYTWIAPSTTGPVTIQSRATDYASRLETPSAGVMISIGSAATAPSTAAPTPPTTTPPTAASVPPAYTWVDGSLVKVSTSPTVYLVAGTHLKPFTGAAVFFARGYKFENVITISVAQLASGSFSTPVLYPDGTLIKGPGATVYLVAGGMKKGIVSLAVMKRLGLQVKNIVMISASDLNDYPDGGVQN